MITALDGMGCGAEAWRGIYPESDQKREYVCKCVSSVYIYYKSIPGLHTASLLAVPASFTVVSAQVL